MKYQNVVTRCKLSKPCKIFLLVPLIFCFLLFASTAFAKPVEGFFEGPYITLQAMLSQVDYDTDQISGEKLGRDFEPSFGLNFGWNITDDLSVDFTARYTTNTKRDGKDEHILSPDIAAKYAPFHINIKDDTSFFIPYIRGGMGFCIAILPGNALSSDKKRTSLGFGPTFGAGFDLLIAKYIFIGANARYDIYNFDNIYQDLDLAAPQQFGQLVYKGGWKGAFSAGISLGVHY